MADENKHLGSDFEPINLVVYLDMEAIKQHAEEFPSAFMVQASLEARPGFVAFVMKEE